MRKMSRQVIQMLKNDKSFIWLIIPFVGYFSSNIMPLICKKVPFINSRQFSGFTLIELIAVLAVIAILVTLVVPNMREFIQEQRLRTHVNEFVSDLSLARNEAIKRKNNVGVCSGSGIGCTAGPWEGGRVVFVDTNNNSAWDNGEPIIRIREPLQNGFTLNNTSPGGNTLIVFAPSGMVSMASIGASAGLSSLAYLFCANRASKQGRSVVVAIGGSLNTATVENACP